MVSMRRLTIADHTVHKLARKATQSRLGMGVNYFAFLPFAGFTRTPLIFHHVLINHQCLVSSSTPRPMKGDLENDRISAGGVSIFYDLFLPGNVSRMSL